VTVGVDVLALGVVVPVFPLFPDELDEDEDDEPVEDEEPDEMPELPESLEPLLLEPLDDGEVVVVVPEPDPPTVGMSDVPAPFDPLEEPGCSPATTTPISAAAPVAANTEARVRVRSRDWARSLRSGVLGSMLCDTGDLRFRTAPIRPSRL
jgi:hypothetical protein